MTRILCVEDNDDNMFVLHRRLTRAGYEVKVAMNGKVGVEWATTLLPDLILMDLNLPGLDGWEATRR
jgi:CheY-like chemotaxis protein